MGKNSVSAMRLVQWFCAARIYVSLAKLCLLTIPFPPLVSFWETHLYYGTWLPN
jgi:hypothetical protein